MSYSHIPALHILKQSAIKCTKIVVSGSSSIQLFNVREGNSYMSEQGGWFLEEDVNKVEDQAPSCALI